MNKNTAVGDTVEFMFKGEKIVGTVLRFRIRKQRKLKNLMRNLGIKDDYPTEFEVIEIAVPGRGIFTGKPDCVIRVIKTDPKAAQKATQYAADLRNNNRAVKGEQQNLNYGNAKKNGLVDLKLPALVFVKYKGGYSREETLVALSPSWQAKIQTFGKTRFLNPKFVFATRELVR